MTMLSNNGRNDPPACFLCEYDAEELREGLCGECGGFKPLADEISAIKVAMMLARIRIRLGDHDGAILIIDRALGVSSGKKVL